MQSVILFEQLTNVAHTIHGNLIRFAIENFIDNAADADAKTSF